ncbi:hypothetical protein AB8Z38_32580 [Bradyrhizobium sp. LLZ17]|jgi:hypothetical protein|uniref:Uncharacterized protein n=1 Tax=Bradyrhizobium sp. LLZ17 TaxID=3239388 RepID=A0AB39XJ77_9BRAD
MKNLLMGMREGNWCGKTAQLASRSMADHGYVSPASLSVAARQGRSNEIYENNPMHSRHQAEIIDLFLSSGKAKYSFAPSGKTGAEWHDRDGIFGGAPGIRTVMAGPVPASTP